MSAHPTELLQDKWGRTSCAQHAQGNTGAGDRVLHLAFPMYGWWSLLRVMLACGNKAVAGLPSGLSHPNSFPGTWWPSVSGTSYDPIGTAECQVQGLGARQPPNTKLGSLTGMHAGPKACTDAYFPPGFLGTCHLPGIGCHGAGALASGMAGASSQQPERPPAVGPPLRPRPRPEAGPHMPCRRPWWWQLRAGGAHP